MPTVSTQLLWNILAALSVLGADAEAVRRRCSFLPDGSTGRTDERLPVAVLHAFWALVVEVTGDPSIGVRVGNLVRTESYGVVGDVLRASATLGDAFLKAVRYMKLWNESVVFSVLIDTDRALVWQRSTAPEHRHPASADAVLTLLLSLSRQLTGHPFVPDEAHFAHPAPRDVSAYEEIFGGVLKFDRPDYALVFAPEILSTPIRTHDSAFRDASVARAEHLVVGVAETASYSLRAAELIEAELRGGNPTLKNIAGRLGLHPKALTRHLKSEGTSHSELLETRRRELALRYVATTDLSMTDIAFLMGFSDAAAFTKSFKRWSGVPPATFRRRAV
jgi:AraC-like DNA-binding protein